MESSKFKDPHSLNEAVSHLSNTINPERCETPDSNKGSQDNDSATSSPRIVKPVLGKAQAKKRLMAFANKYVVPAKIEKTKEKLANPNKNHSMHFNQSKKTPTDSVKILINEVKEAKSRIESELEIREKNDATLQRHCATDRITMKKRSEPKIAAIEEIIREESRQRQLTIHDSDTDKQSYFDRHKIGKHDKSKDDYRHSNWGRRQPAVDNFDRSSNFKDIDLRRIDTRLRHSNERKDAIKNKEHSHNINQSCHMTTDEESYSSLKSYKKSDKNCDKPRNKITHKDDDHKNEKVQEFIQLIKYNSWSDFKSKGGQIRMKSLSESDNENSSKDLKSRTLHDYKTHLEQMLMLGTHRLKRTLAIVDGTCDNKKKYPPESIRATKKIKGSPLFYSENPLVSLLIFRQQLFEFLPSERSNLMREICDATREAVEDDTVSRTQIRCWYKRWNKRAEEQFPKISTSSTVPILPPKSKWDSEDESLIATSNFSNQDDEVKGIESVQLEDIETSVRGGDEALNLKPSIQKENNENDMIVDNIFNRADNKENPEEEIGEKLVFEYEQFMKIVNNDSATTEKLSDQYSPKKSLQETLYESDELSTPPQNEDSIVNVEESTTFTEAVKFEDNGSHVQKESNISQESIVPADNTLKGSENKMEKNDKNQSRIENNSELRGWENIQVKIECTDNFQLSKHEKFDKKPDCTNTKKILPLRENSDSSSSESSSELEIEKNKKKLKKQRKTKQTRDSSSDSSSSSSDSSSENDSNKRRRRRKKKKSKKKSHGKKKRGRKDSTNSVSSSSDLEKLVRKCKKRKNMRKRGVLSKRKKLTSRSYSRSKSRLQSRSKLIDKKKLRKMKKETMDIETRKEIPDIVKEEKLRSPKWQPEIQISKMEIVTNPEKISTKKELLKSLETNSKGKFFNEWDNQSMLSTPDTIKNGKIGMKSDELKQDEGLLEIKDSTPESVNDNIAITELSHNSITKTSVKVNNEDVNDESKSDRKDENDISKSEKPVRIIMKQRNRSSSSGSSNISSASTSSGSSDQKMKQHKSASTKLLTKKLKKYRSKWPESVDFDSLNFPSLTQLDQKVSRSGPSIDDWEVDSMDGVDDLIMTPAKQTSSAKREQKKIKKQVRYDHKTDTYIAVEKKISRESKKKLPSQICALRIWEDEEEEGAREAVMLLKEKTKMESDGNLNCWQPETESLVATTKIEMKMKRKLKDKSASPIQEKAKDELAGWIEIIPEGGIKPRVECVSQQRNEALQWNNSSPNIKKLEEELVPVNWEEETDWISDVKTSSQVPSSEQSSKIDLEKIPTINHGAKIIHDTNNAFYNPSSPAFQKSETADVTSDSSSDSTDSSSSSSDSSESDAESTNEHQDKSDNIGKKQKNSVLNTAMKDTTEESFAETVVMKKLRMDIFAEFTAHDSRDKISKSDYDVKTNSENFEQDLDLESPISSFKLIPPQLISHRVSDNFKLITHMDRRMPFESNEHHVESKKRLVTSTLTNSPSSKTIIDKSPISEIALMVPKMSNFPNVISTDAKLLNDSRSTLIGTHHDISTAEREVICRRFHEISSHDSRSVSCESKLKFSPQSNRDKSQIHSCEEPSGNLSYQSASCGLLRDIDKHHIKTEDKSLRELVFGDDDRRNVSPFSDRVEEKWRSSPIVWNKPRSRSRSWSRSRSRSPKRRDGRSLWDRQRSRAKYIDRHERFSRSSNRGRLPPLIGRDQGRRRYNEGNIERERNHDQDWNIDRNIEKAYDPIEMLRGSYSVNKKRENNSNERRWCENDTIIRRDSDEIPNMMCINRPAPEANIDDRIYRRNESLEKDNIDDSVLMGDFDKSRYRSRSRSRSRERRIRDGEWNRSRESSSSDRFGSRRCQRLSPTRSRASRMSLRLRSSSRKIARSRYFSHSRSRSWTRSRSRSKSRTSSRSRSISRSRSRTRSTSSSRSRSRCGRRSLDHTRESMNKSRRSRSFSPSPHRLRRNDAEKYKRSISQEPARRIETIVHPPGMNPMPPECSPLVSETSTATLTAQFEYNYYARNNLTYPPRLDSSNPSTGSPKRLSLDDRLELELGIKKHQEVPSGVPPFNHLGLNAHVLSYPPPPTGTPLLVPRNSAAQLHGAYNGPPSTVLQVGNVLQVVPGDFSGSPSVNLIRGNLPSATSETNNSNRVVRVGNVLQVVPSTTHDWSGNVSQTAPSNLFDAKPLNNPMPISALTVPLTPSTSNNTPTLSPSPLPNAVPSDHNQPTSVCTLAPIALLPKLEPPKAPSVIQPVYNYEAIMENRQKERIERKRLREEKRQEKKQRRIEKMQRRVKRILGVSNRRSEVVSTDSVTKETESGTSPIAIFTSLINDEDPNDTVAATLGEMDEVTTEIEDDDEEEEEDEEGDVDEDDEDDEDEDEAEDEVEEDESRLVTKQQKQNCDIENTICVYSSGAECLSESSTIATIPLLPPPRKGILIPAGFWVERISSDKLDNTTDDESINTVNKILLQECNDVPTIGNIDEEKSSRWEYEKERQIRTPKRHRLRKSVQFADGIKPGEGTSPSGCESDMPSPPPPVPGSLQDRLHEWVRQSRSRKSRKKAKRIKPQKAKKKIKVKIIKLKKARNTSLTSLMMDDLEEIDDRSPPSPPPGSPPPPHLWPSYLATYSATLRAVETSSALFTNNPTLPPPTPLPLLIPPPPLNYTIQPCNKA